MALSGGIVLEEALDLSYDRLLMMMYLQIDICEDFWDTYRSTAMACAC
jgi:hypothetical protein